MEKKGLDILSNTFKPEWRDILSRTPEGVKETSLALLKKHKDDALMDLRPIVLTQIVRSSEGVGAVLTEFVAGHPDRSILDACPCTFGERWSRRPPAKLRSWKR